MAAAAEMTVGEAKAAVRAWVTGADERRLDDLADGTVLCQVTHSNLKQNIIELRFDLHATVAATKEMLYTYNGTNLDYMELQIFSGDRLVARLLDESKMLGFYGLTHGHRVHVVDHDPMSLSRAGGLDDVSQVAKYRMSEEDYDKREGTLRAWKREQQKKNPAFKYSDALPGAAGKPAIDYEDDAIVDGIEVGQRCQLPPGSRRGEVAFVGRLEGRKGWWVGVRLDEPLGLGNGVANGVRIFEAEPKYGTFIRPNLVTVGDFPVVGFGDDGEADDTAAAAGAAAASGSGAAAPSAGAAAAAAEETKEEAAAAAAAPEMEAEAAARAAALEKEAKAAQKAAARPSALRRRMGDDDDDDDDDDEL